MKISMMGKYVCPVCGRETTFTYEPHQFFCDSCSSVVEARDLFTADIHHMTDKVLNVIRDMDASSPEQKASVRLAPVVENLRLYRYEEALEVCDWLLQDGQADREEMGYLCLYKAVTLCGMPGVPDVETEGDILMVPEIAQKLQYRHLQERVDDVMNNVFAGCRILEDKACAHMAGWLAHLFTRMVNRVQMSMLETLWEFPANTSHGVYLEAITALQNSELKLHMAVVYREATVREQDNDLLVETTISEFWKRIIESVEMEAGMDILVESRELWDSGGDLSLGELYRCYRNGMNLMQPAGSLSWDNTVSPASGQKPEEGEDNLPYEEDPGRCWRDMVRETVPLLCTQYLEACEVRGKASRYMIHLARHIPGLEKIREELSYDNRIIPQDRQLIREMLLRQSGQKTSPAKTVLPLDLNSLSHTALNRFLGTPSLDEIIARMEAAEAEDREDQEDDEDADADRRDGNSHRSPESDIRDDDGDKDDSENGGGSGPPSGAPL